MTLFSVGLLVLMLMASPAINSAFVIHPSRTGDSSPLASPQTKTPHHRNHNHSPLFASTDNIIVNDLASHYTSPSVLDWLQKMAISYELERGEELLQVIAREGSKDDASVTNTSNNNNDLLLHLATVCARTNLPIASHDFLRDPTGDAIYNYGNLAFLHGFGYGWDEFVQLPSRYSVASDEEVKERQRLLDAVKSNAMKSEGKEEGEDDEDLLASGYDNLIRVRKDERRILLRGVNLWNVYDIDLEDIEENSILIIKKKIEKGEIKAIGQAVWIRDVEYLD